MPAILHPHLPSETTQNGPLSQVFTASATGMRSAGCLRVCRYQTSS